MSMLGPQLALLFVEMLRDGILLEEVDPWSLVFRGVVFLTIAYIVFFFLLTVMYHPLAARFYSSAWDQATMHQIF